MSPDEALALLGIDRAACVCRSGASRDFSGGNRALRRSCSGSILADRYLMDLDDGTAAVLRVDRPAVRRLGLDRAAELQALQMAAAAGLGPAPLAAAPEHGLLLTAWVPGHAWTRADLLAGRNLERATSLLRTVHALQAAVPAVDLAAAADRYALLAGPEHAGLAIEVRTLLDEAAAGESSPRFCHGDPFVANFIDDRSERDGSEDDGSEGGGRGRLYLIDWEYAGLNEPWFDLAGLAGHNDLPAEAEDRLLASYLGRRPDSAERRRLTTWRRFYERLAVLWMQAVIGSTRLE